MQRSGRSPESESEIVATTQHFATAGGGTSVQEIDRLISELQSLRDVLHEEGARVQREITE